MSFLNSGRFKRTQLSWAVLCLITGNAFAFTSGTGQSYSVTKDEFRPELHRNALGLDRIDTFSGSLKINIEDVRLRGNGGLDLVVMRNYSPVMSFRGLVDHVAFRWPRRLICLPIFLMAASESKKSFAQVAIGFPMACVSIGVLTGRSCMAVRMAPFTLLMITSTV